MYRITTTYPEDPRSPFYDPSTKEMHPLARLYLTREKIIPSNCDEKFLTSQIDVSENTEDTSRGEDLFYSTNLFQIGLNQETISHKTSQEFL